MRTLRVAVVWLGRVAHDTGGRTYLSELLPRLATQPGLTLDLHFADRDFAGPAGYRAVVHDIPVLLGRYGRLIQEPLVGARLNGRYDVLLAPFNVVPHGWRGPTVVVMHNVLAFGEPARAILRSHHARYREWAVRSALRRADVILCVSAYLRELVLAHFPRLDAARVDVAPLGVAERFFEVAGSGGVKDSPPRVIVVSALWSYKRVDQAIEAFAEATRDIHDARLQIAGPYCPSQRARLERIARIGGVQAQVEFLGNVSERDLPDLYRGAGALLYPSEIESFGLPVLEAMAAGVPVVAKAIRAVREIGGDGPRCVPAAAGRAELAAALRRVLFDPVERQRRIEAGRERARIFTWDRTASLTAEALARAVGHRRAFSGRFPR